MPPIDQCIREVTRRRIEFCFLASLRVLRGPILPHPVRRWPNGDYCLYYDASPVRFITSYIAGATRDVRISFDLDDTLICYGDGVECEPRLPWILRLFIRDEPLRRGSTRLLRELHDRGHELWVYTTSDRGARAVRWWLRAHGIHVSRMVNGTEHAKCFGQGSSPTKRPHAFGIDLHIDDSEGVAIEGERYGFRVCVVEPSADDWVERVLAAVDSANRNGGRPARCRTRKCSGPSRRVGSA
jgi:hypothetical protein